MRDSLARYANGLAASNDFTVIPRGVRSLGDDKSIDLKITLA